MDGSPEEEDTKENSEEFAKKLAEYLTKNGTNSSKYQYVTRFQYYSDITPPVNALHLVACYYLDSNVLALVKYIYPTMPPTMIAEDDKMVACFFGW
jgi:hypothetical protein